MARKISKKAAKKKARVKGRNIVAKSPGRQHTRGKGDPDPSSKAGSIRAYLTKHPKAEAPEVIKALGIEMSSSELSKARRVLGLIAAKAPKAPSARKQQKLPPGAKTDRTEAIVRELASTASFDDVRRLYEERHPEDPKPLYHLTFYQARERAGLPVPPGQRNAGLTRTRKAKAAMKRAARGEPVPRSGAAQDPHSRAGQARAYLAEHPEANNSEVREALGYSTQELDGGSLAVARTALGLRKANRDVKSHGSKPDPNSQSGKARTYLTEWPEADNAEVRASVGHISSSTLAGIRTKLGLRRTAAGKPGPKPKRNRPKRHKKRQPTMLELREYLLDDPDATRPDMVEHFDDSRITGGQVFRARRWAREQLSKMRKPNGKPAPEPSEEALVVVERSDALVEENEMLKWMMVGMSRGWTDKLLTMLSN